MTHSSTQLKLTGFLLIFLKELVEEIYKDKLEAHEKIVRDKSLSQGIQSMIEACQSLGASRETVLNLVIEKFNLTAEEAEKNMKMYW